MGSFVAESDTGQIKEARSIHISSLLVEAMQEALRVGLSLAEMQILVDQMLNQMRLQQSQNKGGK